LHPVRDRISVDHLAHSSSSYSPRQAAGSMISQMKSISTRVDHFRALGCSYQSPHADNRMPPSAFLPPPNLVEDIKSLNCELSRPPTPLRLIKISLDSRERSISPENQAKHDYKQGRSAGNRSYQVSFYSSTADSMLDKEKKVFIKHTQQLAMFDKK